MTGDRFEDGLAVRREVLGAEHVDRALERATDFDDRSRTSSRAIAGVRCGRVRGSTDAHAACSTWRC